MEIRNNLINNQIKNNFLTISRQVFLDSLLVKTIIKISLTVFIAFTVFYCISRFLKNKKVKIQKNINTNTNIIIKHQNTSSSTDKVKDASSEKAKIKSDNLETDKSTSDLKDISKFLLIYFIKPSLLPTEKERLELSEARPKSNFSPYTGLYTKDDVTYIGTLNTTPSHSEPILTKGLIIDLRNNLRIKEGSFDTDSAFNGQYVLSGGDGITYDASGNMLEIGTYLHGKLHGYGARFRTDGSVYESGFYDNGKISKSMEYTKPMEYTLHAFKNDDLNIKDEQRTKAFKDFINSIQPMEKIPSDEGLPKIADGYGVDYGSYETRIGTFVNSQFKEGIILDLLHNSRIAEGQFMPMENDTWFYFLHGKGISYRTDDNTMCEKGEFAQGKLNGKGVRYDSTGKVIESGLFEEGVLKTSIPI